MSESFPLIESNLSIPLYQYKVAHINADQDMEDITAEIRKAL
jgi:hypothetical protein